MCTWRTETALHPGQQPVRHDVMYRLVQNTLVITTVVAVPLYIIVYLVFNDVTIALVCCQPAGHKGSFRLIRHPSYVHADSTNTTVRLRQEVRQ